MSHPFLYLTDLDHSLFQSIRADGDGKHPMTIDSEGVNHGHAREDQHRLFEMLRTTGIVIPVTARSHAQMERVAGWITGQDYDLALTDLGGTLLLRDNNGDGFWHAVPSWHEAYLDALEKQTPSMIRDYQWIKEILAADPELAGAVQVDLITLGKLRLPLYIALAMKGDIKRTQHVLKTIAEPMAKMTQSYLLHESDSIICLWPKFVSKGAAVQRLLEMVKTSSGDERLDHALDYLALKDRVVVTLGDSMTDIEFMRHGDFMMNPRKSPIAEHMIAASTQLMMPV